MACSNQAITQRIWPVPTTYTRNMASQTSYTMNMAGTFQLHNKYDLYKPLTRGIWPIPTNYIKNMTSINPFHKEYGLYQTVIQVIWPVLTSYTRNMCCTNELHKEYGLNIKPVTQGIWPVLGFLPVETWRYICQLKYGDRGNISGQYCYSTSQIYFMYSFHDG